MGIFEKVSETIASTGKDVASKAKAVADIAKLRQQILADEDKLTEYYAELGKKYYREHSEDISEEDTPLCTRIYALKAQIDKNRQQLYAMRGVKVCDKCGAEAEESNSFCGICGAKLPERPVEEKVTVAADSVYEESGEEVPFEKAEPEESDSQNDE